MEEWSDASCIVKPAIAEVSNHRAVLGARVPSPIVVSELCRRVGIRTPVRSASVLCSFNSDKPGVVDRCDG
eukprot:10559434-Lingulodinium_polyedra.AAC.1